MKLMIIHRKYLINKISLILLALIVIVGLLINLSSIFALNNEYNWFESSIAKEEFLESFLLYYKLVVINLMCYLWGSSFNKQNDSYHLLITGYQKIKSKYVISKILVLIIITIMVIFINFYLMSLLGVTCSNFYAFDKKVFELFVSLLFVCIIYGLLSCFFSLLFNNNYAYFLSSCFFVFGELIKDGNSLVKLYFVFFPSISLGADQCSYGLIHLFLLLIIYACLVVIGYVYKK